MAKVKMYTKKVCPYCVRAKNLLNSKGVPFEEIDVEATPGFYETLKKQTGWMTVPQIFIGEKLIGGFTDLDALDKSGELDKLLGA